MAIRKDHTIPLQNMKRPPLIFPLLVGALIWLVPTLFSRAAEESTDNLTRWVDPRIGVLAAGSTVIGPAIPFGSIHPSPDTPKGGHDGYSPNEPIRGFSQLHVSGTGWGQYGNILVSPQIGLTTLPTEHDSPKSDEKAEASQYAVTLDRYGIRAEVTPAARSAIYRFAFPESDQAHVVIDAAQHIPGDISTGMFKYTRRPIPAEVEISEDGRSVSGMGRYPGGFGGPYTVYFHAEFDRAPAEFGTWTGAKTNPGELKLAATATPEDHLGTYARFDTKADEPVSMKIGVSFRSIEHARESLNAEIPGFDYDAVRTAADKEWNNALASIEITGGTDEQRTIFYTALYHAMIMPRDRTGEFERFDIDTPMWDDHYAIWDTWRTLYPLLTFLRPDIVRDTVNSFIERQRVDGTVPDTFIAGVNKFDEQGGNGVDMIIADAHAKGVSGIDWEQAYGVMKHNADHRRTGADFDRPGSPAPYRTTGWIPAGIMSNSFTLEYAYNDFAAAQVAAALGKTEDAETYLARSRQWENLWNPDVENDGFKGFIMPREADGTWVDFDTTVDPGSWKDYFYEANSWTYSYFAPHQIDRLVTLMGGPERYVERLEHALDKDLLKLGNEPSFLIPQTFHHVGRPDLAARTLHDITTERFTLRGYPGDDDSGAMSSYYIWSKIGLFPNAGQDIYYLNGPAFDRIVVTRPGQGPLTITRTGPGIYVAGVTLNGKALEQSWIRHAELDGTVELAFTMSDTPTEWAQESPPPPSLAAAN